MPLPHHVLLIDDSMADRLLIERTVKKHWPDILITPVDSRVELESALTTSDIDLVLSDYHMPGLACETVLSLAQRFQPDAPFLVISGSIDDMTTTNILKAGACCVLRKTRLEDLKPGIELCLHERKQHYTGRRNQHVSTQEGKA